MPLPVPARAGAPGLAIIAGALSATGFAPLGWWIATVLALAGLILLLHRTTSGRTAFLLGWCFGFGQFVVGLNWIATAFLYQDTMPPWLGWIAVVLLSVYLALYPGLATLIAKRTGCSAIAPLTIALAAAWIATEWLRATLFTGFAWNPLAATLVDIATITRWIGTYGLSAVVVLAAGAIALICEGLFSIGTRREGGIHGRGTRWIAAAALSAPLALTAALAALTPPAPAPGAEAPLLRIVQPNINQNEKWDEALAQRNYQRLASLSGMPGAHPRLLLWPEAAVPDYLDEEPWARARLATLLGPRDLLLLGGNDLVYDRAGKLVAAHNSLFAIDSGGRILGRYDKAHLVPYGEYLPMRAMLSAIGLSRLAPGDLDFLPGPGPRTLDLPRFGQAGIQICYEMIFSGNVVDPHARPDFLFNPSNDAWFGRWGPPQHLAQARLRAVEEGLPIVRATPTGISAIIDADGHIVRALAWRQAGAIEAALPPSLPPTPFARYGNLLPALLAAFLGLILIAVRYALR